MGLSFKKLTSSCLCPFAILILLLAPVLSVSQAITGKIQNSEGEKIAIANVLIKDSAGSEQIRQFVIARNGEYSITLKGFYQKVIIEVTAGKYLKEIFQIDNPFEKQSYTCNFILQKDRSVQLKEVIVTAKTKPFSITGDTVKYNVAGYCDGSERKLEDILKKLPGIQVNEKTGEVTYKGRSIETVKLEGDDLFGSGYVIGTRNINADMIEQVQAIENYSANPLLKGIENSDKVALNLQLKRKKTDFSGNADFGTGVSDAGNAVFNVASNVLGISKKYKAYGTLSFNNVGVNNSPFDYFSYNPGVEEMRETALFAKIVIPETYFSSGLDDKRANTNRALFGNYNNIFKIGNRVSVKTSLYYLHDRITSEQLFQNSNFINNRQILTSDNSSVIKTPSHYRGDAEIKFNSSRKSLVEYKLKLGREDIVTAGNIVQNNLTNHLVKLGTENFNLRQALQFTQKIADKKAFQVLVNQSVSNSPQNYFLNPSVFDPLIYTSDNQFSNFKKNIVGIQSVFLGSTQNTKYSFSIGTRFEKNTFHSKLISKNESSGSVNDGLHNDLTYINQTFYHTGAYNISFAKWRFLPSYSVSHLQQELDSSLGIKNIRQGNFILEPSFSINYTLNNFSAIRVTAAYTEQPFSEEYIFSKPVYISNRTSIKNKPGVQLRKITTYTVYYLVNNLYKQFQMNVAISYNKNGGNYFSDINIQENSTQIKYFYLPGNNENINASFLIEKYVPSLESTIRCKSNYAVSNYKNVVNMSGLRHNKGDLISSEFFIKTAFDIKINFENVIRYSKNMSKSENSQSFASETINNNFKIIIKHRINWLFLLSADYFLLWNGTAKNDYLFLDGLIRFTPKKKLYEFSFMAKNILDKRYFQEVQTTDYSTNYFQSSLIPGYFMVSLSHNF